MKHLKISNLEHCTELEKTAQRSVIGGGVSNAFLFRSAPRLAQLPMNLNIANLEINNYDIDKLIQQTNNQLQLSTINVNAGDGASIIIDSMQGLNGSNSSVA